MEGFKIIRDEKRCVSCGECVIVCPQSAEGQRFPVLVLSPVPGKPPEVRCIENCIQCMTCWDFCRAHAITFVNHHAVRRLVEPQALLRKAARII